MCIALTLALSERSHFESDGTVASVGADLVLALVLATVGILNAFVDV